MSNPPDTIVLVHGFWVTPRSWEHWIAHYEAKGFRVLAPAYPGFEVEVEALNADPTPIEQVTVPAIIEHLEAIVGGLDTPPILMGHSAGGVFTQILLDHGFGAAGVAINSAPTEGVKRVPLSQMRAIVPGAQEPGEPAQGGRPHVRAVALHVHQHVPRGRGARAVRALPHPRVRRDLLGQRARQHPARAQDDTWVDYHNDDRAPLLFISGSEDHLMPPSVQQSNAKHYKSDTHHRDQGVRGAAPAAAQRGWEQVADYALEWALEHAKTTIPTTA